jgi:hypothetical protein
MTNEKGTRRERQARAIHESAGYKCQPFRETRYREGDGFGHFDFMAVHPDRRPRLVQVKSNRGAGIAAISSFARSALPWPEHIEVDLAVCHDREGWRVLQPRADNGHETVLDERAMSCDMGSGYAAALESGGI